jgi:putative FmdB family regulatory protein
MPIYEYECRKCKAHTEILQKVTDKPLTKCSKCGGRLEKQWSSTSFQFKGTGWYVTDYAGKKTDAKEESKTSAPVKEEKKSAPESNASSDKATPKETTPSKKTNTSKTAPSSGD